jgi:hypothetical protein
MDWMPCGTHVSYYSTTKLAHEAIGNLAPHNQRRLFGVRAAEGVDAEYEEEFLNVIHQEGF